MPPSYEYHRPGSLEEACKLLAELPQAQILAGGTDLLVDLDTGIRQAKHVISLRSVTGLAQIRQTDGGVSVGAACTARQIQLSPLIQKDFPELSEMVVEFACPQVRTRATAAGNICSAVPCGDFPVILMALGAAVELTSTGNSRVVALEDFFTGPRETVRQPDELLARILVPAKPPGAHACYVKYKRRASNSLAVASVGAFLRLQDGVCSEARIVLGAVAPVPLFAAKTSASLVGNSVNTAAIVRAAEIAQNEAVPITDVRSTKTYRRELVGVLTQRALKKVVAKIG